MGKQTGRSRKIVVLALEVTFFVAVFQGVSAYKAQGLLDADGKAAPALTGTTLQGERYDLGESTGKPVLLYFFAPWCPYCSASADNLVRLRRLRASEKLEIVAVALDWTDAAQIKQYSEEHGLNFPVLLAGSTVASDWNIHGFPTYYVLDSKHRVIQRDIGYSTQLGLLWRSWVLN